ncbi:HAD hydrolase-like protein [archaeon]|nr:HAD hydrolase-like protein [archaeon]
MKIKAVILDSSVLFNVPTKELKNAFKEVIKYHIPYNKAIKDYKTAFRKLQKGELSKDEFYKQAFKKAPAKSMKKIIKQHDIKRDELITLEPGVKAVINSLIKEYKLGLISNMPKNWFLKDAKRLGINLKSFNNMVFGSEVGVLKPNVKLYNKMIGSLKEEPERCVYVTNDEYEVPGARKAGMNVVTINNDKGDLTINSIKELITLFSNIDKTPKQVHEVDVP